jgi:hypothetical protein
MWRTARPSSRTAIPGFRGRVGDGLSEELSTLLGAPTLWLPGGLTEATGFGWGLPVHPFNKATLAKVKNEIRPDDLMLADSSGLARPLSHRPVAVSEPSRATSFRGRL